MPELENFVCVYCHKDGLHPEQDSDLCIDGNQHVITPKNVAEKTYFLAGPAMQRYGQTETGKSTPPVSRTIVTGCPPTIYPPSFPPGGDESVLNGRDVEFLDNRYTTSSAVEQYWLDKRGEEIPGWLTTEEGWESNWLTPVECRERRIARIEAEIESLKAAATEA